MFFLSLEMNRITDQYSAGREGNCGREHAALTTRLTDVCRRNTDKSNGSLVHLIPLERSQLCRDGRADEERSPTRVNFDVAFRSMNLGRNRKDNRNTLTTTS